MTANCHTLFLEFICLCSTPLLIQHSTVNCLLGNCYVWKSCEVLPHHVGLTLKLIPHTLGLCLNYITDMPALWICILTCLQNLTLDLVHHYKLDWQPLISLELPPDLLCFTCVNVVGFCRYPYRYCPEVTSCLPSWLAFLSIAGILASPL